MSSGLVSTIGKVLISPVGAALGVLNGPKAPRQALPLPTATPRSNATVLSDALTRRRGSADNRRTGIGGAESSTAGKKTLLGS